MLGGRSYANVTSTLALVVALGGTGYAAVTLPRNSVGSEQLKRNAVANSDIRSDAVTSNKVRDGSLRSRDFRSSDLPVGATGPQGPQGTPGMQGPAGAKGDKGDTGASPVTRFARVNAGRTVVAASPGTSAAPDPGNSNYTRVTFDRDVSTCTLSVMAGAVDGTNFVVTRRANAESLGVSGSGAGSIVRVIITDAAGTAVTSSFHLIAFC